MSEVLRTYRSLRQRLQGGKDNPC
ncbi:hypothetical protein EMIT051CA3_30936 [Pseudomonas chlororaphis]